LAAHLHFRPGSDRRPPFSSALEHPHDADDVFWIMGAEANSCPKEKFTMKKRINLKVTTIQNLVKQLFKKIEINILKNIIGDF